MNFTFYGACEIGGNKILLEENKTEVAIAGKKDERGVEESLKIRYLDKSVYKHLLILRCK
jgi:hypothetical protein